MTRTPRYADPTRCPDCSGPIVYGDLTCPTCGLPLRGDTAARLFQTLTVADSLLDALRAGARVPVGAATGPVPSGTAVGGLPGTGSAGRVAGPVAGPVAGDDGIPGGPGLPGGPSLPPPPAHHGLTAASVPKILLTLGAACLLIAALVFLAVTWSVMGVGGRTATLVGFTLITAGLAAAMARRDLRGAAEALSVVSLGLLTLDTFGAQDAGWLGDLSTASFLVVLGVLLAVVAGAAAVLVRRTPAGGLTGAQIVAGLGVGVAGIGVGDLDAISLPLAQILAVLVAGSATAVAHRARLTFTTALAGFVAAVFWMVQLADATSAAAPASLHSLWVDLDAWRLLVAAALVGVLVRVTALPRPARVAAAATAYGVLTLTAGFPSLYDSATAVALAALGALVAAALVTWLLPRPWGLTGTLVQAVAGLSALATLASVAVLATTRLADAASAAWAGTTGGHLVGTIPGELPAAWLAPLCVLALAGTALALAKASPTADRVVSTLTDVPVATAVLLLSGVATLASYDVPVWSVVLVLLVAAAGFLAWWLHRRAVSALLATTVFTAGALGVGAYDEWLSAAALAAALLIAGAVHLRAAPTDLAGVAGAVVAGTLAGSAWTWGTLAGAAEPWTALAGLVLLGAVVLTLHLYPDEWWGCEAPATARAGVEVGAAVSALPLGMAGVLLADRATEPTWTAVYLTVAGVVVTALSLLREDRRALTWLGGLLLTMASWVRLWDIGVREPEPYTLPSAVVLLAVGLVYLRRHYAAATITALAPGLGLALVPSLLWVLADPAGLRALLLGLACLGLLVGGLRLRWTAPVVAGAVVGGIEVVRLAAPYIGDAVPRWVLIGAAGALLILLGVTWERRLRDARQVIGFVQGLR
ncbi:MAG: SCO7613 C-terminal domain-containing membrane protein [Nocardioides sp.]